MADPAPERIGLGERLARRASLARATLERSLIARGILRRGRFPDFLGIGAQKAGTTWLHANLRLHPELFLPETKEIHYFDRAWFRPLSGYLAEFEGAGDRVAGEITPAYGIIPEQRIAFIRRMNPGLRLLFIMRDPVERAWSQALMNLVRRTGRANEDVAEAELLAYVEDERSLSRGDYLGMLDRWGRHFPQEQLLVGFFEEVAEAPEALLTRVFRHLGVSTDVDWDRFPVRRVVFGGRRHAMPARVANRLSEIYADDLAELERRFGAPVTAWRR